MNLRPALVLSVLAVAAAPTVQAGEAPPVELAAGIVSPRARIGTPSRAEDVQEALRHARGLNDEAEMALAYLLAETGGLNAAHGLVELTHHRNTRVRASAFRSAARIGLRVDALRERAHRSLDAVLLEERLAAIEALGALGDGRDVPLLLALAEDEDPAIRAAAFRTLRTLTGLAIPYDLERWSYWWKLADQRARAQITDALEAFEGEEEVSLHQRLAVLELGWVEAPLLQRGLRRWLNSPDKRLRLEACQLATRHRIADLAPEIVQTYKFASAPELKAVSREALESFGMPVEEFDPEMAREP
ncbi:MAG: HEAT repeat domain-containing protein [Planctomycetota bacterium]|jgi:hypothetical protein